MTRKEAFETFHKKRMHLQLAMPGSHGFHKDYAYSDAQVAWNAWDAACDYGAQQMQNKIIDKLGSYDANKCAQIAASIPIEDI